MKPRALLHAMTALCLLAPLTLHAHSGAFYSHESALPGTDKNWMAAVDGNKRVRELSVPGTHDSLSLYGGDIVQTQSLSLRNQLNAGIRAFDVRARHINNVFAIHHGPVFQNVMFGTVLGEMAAFLRENPSETLLVRVKQEHTEEGNTRSFEATFADYYQQYAGYIWQPTGQDPLLNEVRGKIVFLQNFSGARYGLNYAGSFSIQDDFEMGTNWDLYSKWEKVKAQMIRANALGHSSINYLSAAVGSFPYFVASGHSSPQTGAPRLLTGLTTPGWSSSYPDFPRVGCFIGICSIAFEGTNELSGTFLQAGQGYLKYVGIVMADFPGQGLIQQVVRLNYGSCNSWAYDAGSRAGDIYRYDNPYTATVDYFRAQRSGPYGYFPINQTSNGDWQFLGHQPRCN